MSVGINIQNLDKAGIEDSRSVPGGSLALSYNTEELTSLRQIEESRQFGLLASWEDLLDADPAATLFQGPSWTLQWYRVYQERYEPRVLILTYGGSLVGLIPLAVERSNRTLVFASSNMADYRDVIALPQHKRMLIEKLVRMYHNGRFNRSTLWLGPTLPESQTATIAGEVCKGIRGIYAIPRSHPGWRWWPDGSDAAGFLKKKSVRQAMKHYQRQGGPKLERIETLEEWHRFKHEFFDQHSLRQIYVGRPVSFNDSLKQEFYEALISDHPDQVHVVSLRVAGRIVAAHYGPLRDGVLYWGAPSFDIRDARHSPGLVLMALIMHDAERLGIRGIDLTIGVEEYKRRFSNCRVDLPSVELHSGHLGYYKQVVRDRFVAGAKMVVAKYRGQESWDPTKAHLERLTASAERVGELGVKESMTRFVRRCLKSVGERATWLTLIATPEDLQPVEPRLAPSERCTYNANELRDLLRWEGPPSDTAREIRVRVRNAPEELRKGRTLHTVLVNGKLACWGWSYWPQGPEMIDVIEAELDFAPMSVSLYDFYTIPAFRKRRIYQALLTHILRSRFDEGAERAYIMVRDTNVASRKAIEHVGFRLVEVDEITRVLGKQRTLRRTEMKTDQLVPRGGELGTKGGPGN